MKFFSYDNPLWAFVGRLIDVIVLHFLWIICSLPILTFGASTTAFYYAMLKDTGDEDTHYIKAFFRSFKMNLKPAMLLGIVTILFVGGLGFTIIFCSRVNDPTFISEIVKILSLIALFLVVCILSYAYPLMARFNNTTFGTIRNAFLLSIRHFGWTLLMAILFLGWYFVILYFEQIPLIVILGFGLVVYIDSYLLNPLLKPYIIEQQKRDGTYVPEVGDEWALDETTVDQSVDKETTETGEEIK